MKESPELEARVRRMFTAAYVDHDAATLQNLGQSSRDSRNRLILTADDEVWQGGPDNDSGEFFAYRSKQLGTTGVEFDLIEAFEHGDVGWIAAIMTVFRSSGEPMKSRFTGTYVLEDGGWRVVQWHASVGVPNMDAFGVELSEDFGALVESMDHSTEAAIAASSTTGTVTLLFSDVEDSTQLTEQIGDAEWASIITRHLLDIETTVTEHGGTLVKTLGDGAMASFGSVTDALDSALTIQRTASDSPFKVRVGVHTGDAIQADGDYIGTTVNKAARIASAASPGEIVLSAVTAELAGGRGFDLGNGRSVELKGLAGTHRVVQLQGRT